MDVLAFADAGGALAAIIWGPWALCGCASPSAGISCDFDGWMWRDDISIRRDAVHAVHVVDFFDRLL